MERRSLQGKVHKLGTDWQNRGALSFTGPGVAFGMASTSLPRPRWLGMDSEHVTRSNRQCRKQRCNDPCNVTCAVPPT